MIYSESSKGGTCLSSEPFSDRSDEHIEFYPKSLHQDNPNSFYQDQIDVDVSYEIGEVLWLVVVRYETGSTFGRIYGAWHVVGLSNSRKEASKIEQQILDNQYEGFTPWIGYCERFSEIEVYRVVLDP